MTPPKGYKHTELGVLPEDWEVVRLGDVCEIQMCKRIFSHQTRQDFEIPFFKIGTLGGTPDAFISRDLFELYRNKYNFPQKGEVMITCSGTIGRCIQYDGKDAYFQDSNIVWLHNQQGEVLSNNFAFIALSNQDWSMLSSTTITRLYTTDLKKIQIPLPPLAEQEKIAEILSTWDTQIQNFETLIAEKQALKKGLCQTLLTAKTRLKEFSEDWEMKEFKKIFKRIPSKKFQIQTKDYKKIGKYPIVDQGKAKIIAYSDCDEKVLRVSDVILFGDHTREVKYINFDFIVGADGVQLFRSFSENNLFLYYFLSSQHIPNTGYNRHFKFVESMLFPLPPLTEQEKIAEILSEADNEITLLEQKLESLKSQKRGLMQILLNGKVRTRI